MRLRDWEDWRFRWPSRYRDVFRQPQEIFLGEELPLVDPIRGRIPRATAVWLAPPADMGRPVWRDVLEQTQLGPAERMVYLAEVAAVPDRRRAHRLWERIAAKEAARRLWHSAGRPATYPADLAVIADEADQSRLIRVEQPDDDALPTISIAHTDGVSVAMAALDPDRRIGIAVATIVDPPDSFEVQALTTREQSFLSRWPGPGRAEWVARFGCAKETAAKAMGMMDPVHGMPRAEVVGLDENSGVLQVQLVPDRLAACPDRPVKTLRVVSTRRAEYVWAWTLGEGVEP
jgi:phosphopantetheinyl transferase (holo-ACP synthase)